MQKPIEAAETLTTSRRVSRSSSVLLTAEGASLHSFLNSIFAMEEAFQQWHSAKWEHRSFGYYYKRNTRIPVVENARKTARALQRCAQNGNSELNVYSFSCQFYIYVSLCHFVKGNVYRKFAYCFVLSTWKSVLFFNFLCVLFFRSTWESIDDSCLEIFAVDWALNKNYQSIYLSWEALHRNLGKSRSPCRASGDR